MVQINFTSSLPNYNIILEAVKVSLYIVGEGIWEETKPNWKAKNGKCSMGDNNSQNIQKVFPHPPVLN